MKLASLDIGTNAVLLLIMDKKAGLEEILDRSTITRLGQGLLQHGRLSTEAMDRSLIALKAYGDVIRGLSARVVRCFGTSALREADNRDEFITLAKTATGLDVEVFSEYQEAYYTYLSVRDDPAVGGRNLAIVDIGGGSTEITRGDRKAFHDYLSLPVGTVKLTEQFIRHDPPLKGELERLAAYVRQMLTIPPGNEAAVVGMAGTMTTLASIILGLKEFDKKKIHGFQVSMEALDAWINMLSHMSIARRRSLPGMERGREDLLLQGMILMREILASLNAPGFTVSTRGARYGAILEAVEKMARKG